MIELLLEAERALATGQLDQAGRLYRQVVDADPRNAIAVVGLARVALERGNEREAERLAVGALAIDPQDAAAGRLLEQLHGAAPNPSPPNPAPRNPATAGPAPAATTPGQPGSERRPGLLRRLLRIGRS